MSTSIVQIADNSRSFKKSKSKISVQKVVILIFFALIGVFILTNIRLSQHYITMDGLFPHPHSALTSRLRSHSSSVFRIPEGEAVALPGLAVPEETINRKFYGGHGDAKHLGGFTDYDSHGISPAVWKHMITYFGVKSLLDVGCGRGISTAWFYLHGVDTLCVEGSRAAIQQTILPNATKLIEHDFARGPWWPATTVDAVWSVEFLEHVGRNYHKNYIPAFRKAALIFATHSEWGGWHHVEVHDDTWWLNKMESYGFRYSQSLTELVRKVAIKESNERTIMSPNGIPYNAQHVWSTMQVFINPMVASLPEHEHLFAEHGCGAKGDPRECEEGGISSTLPRSFYPLNITQEMDDKWETLVKNNIKQSK